MSKDFRARLTSIGLCDYVDRLIDEGFDSWDVLVDITEADLYVLALLPPPAPSTSTWTTHLAL